MQGIHVETITVIMKRNQTLDMAHGHTAWSVMRVRGWRGGQAGERAGEGPELTALQIPTRCSRAVRLAATVSANCAQSSPRQLMEREGEGVM